MFANRSLPGVPLRTVRNPADLPRPLIEIIDQSWRIDRMDFSKAGKFETSAAFPRLRVARTRHRPGSRTASTRQRPGTSPA
jgi:hypothetical protein